MKYVDPTEARTAQDNEERKKERAIKPDHTKSTVKSIFREAAAKGSHGPVKTTAAGYRAAAINPRRVK